MYADSAESEDWTLPRIEGAPEKNIYWLETVFYTFKCNIQNLSPNNYFQSKLFGIPNLEEYFVFKTGKSLNAFTIQLHRKMVNSDKRPDNGFRLDIWFTLLSSGKDPELRTMTYANDIVDVSYGMDILNKKDNWTLKCVIKLFEMTSLWNKLSATQNELIKHLASESDESGRKAREMAFLLKRKNLEDIFSGRQETSFTILKTGFIKRTFRVVHQIALKFSAKVKRQPYETGLNLGVYLNYIWKDVGKSKKSRSSISKKDCVSLYLDAHRFGLDFLKIECSEFMLKNLDSEFIVDVLLVSDIVQDEALMNKALNVFLSNKDKIEKSNRWIALSKNFIEVIESIMVAVIRKVSSGYDMEHVLNET